MQCQANSKRTKEQCNGKAVKGTSYCRMHGGTAIQSGKCITNLKHGARSKHLPDMLREGYEAAISDPNLLNLDSDVALLRVLTEKHLSGFTEEAGISGDTLLNMSHVIDRLGKLVERREKVTHLQQNVITHDKLIVWLTQLANGLQGGIEQHVHDADDKQALINHVRMLVAGLGVPTVSQ